MEFLDETANDTLKGIKSIARSGTKVIYFLSLKNVFSFPVLLMNKYMGNYYFYMKHYINSRLRL